MSDYSKKAVAAIAMLRRGLLSDEPVEFDDLYGLLVDTLNNIEHAVVSIRIDGATPEQAHDVKMRIARDLGKMRRRQSDSFRQLEKTLAMARGLSLDSDVVVDVTDTMEQYEGMLREQTLEALDLFEHLLVGDPKSEIQ